MAEKEHNISDELEEGLDLDSEFIVLAVPASSVEVTISAKIWKDGEIIEVRKVMPFEEVRAAIKEAQEGYIPSDALFMLAQTPAEKLEKLLREYAGKMDVE